jgi:hypothetical protein
MTPAFRGALLYPSSELKCVVNGRPGVRRSRLSTNNTMHGATTEKTTNYTQDQMITY